MGNRNSTGGLDAAARTSKELNNWQASSLPLDVMLSFGAKDTIDDRSRDMMLNNGYVNGAISVHRDSIVGEHYRLNSIPKLEALGLKDNGWGDEFQLLVESRFNLVGDSTNAYFDASGMNTFTSMIRLAICMYLYTGEVLATAEWADSKDMRPFRTMIQMINSKRLCNPNDQADTQFMRNGVEIDSSGRPVRYWIRDGERFDLFHHSSTWKGVQPYTKWGRKQVIHIIEQQAAHQHRGISEMVAVLKQLRMTSKYQDMVLQQAVLQASYAASIESELPREMVAEQMGQGDGGGYTQAAAEYLTGYAAYTKNSGDINLDGVRVPVLFPGTKLNLRQLANPAGVGSSYEESMLRHIAAGFNMSYEQFSRDYTKTNYSSARASMNETWKSMRSRKKHVADRFASEIYKLWLEEQFNLGEVPLPPGKDLKWLYSNPMHLDALANASWIGASRGQIDELKETQSAILRINAGFSTLEQEAANLGRDWRDVANQRAKELKYLDGLGLTTSSDISKPQGKDTVVTNDKDSTDEQDQQ